MYGLLVNILPELPFAKLIGNRSLPSLLGIIRIYSIPLGAHGNPPDKGGFISLIIVTAQAKKPIEL